MASYSLIGKAAATRYGQPFTGGEQPEAYNDSDHRMNLLSWSHLVTRLKKKRVELYLYSLYMRLWCVQRQIHIYKRLTVDQGNFRF